METAKGREIKFRAWTGTEMIYEGFHISAPGIAWSWIDFTATDSKALGFPVMQYTGLLDKNGVEIYEGDVVKVDFSKDYKDGYDSIQVIEFYEGSFGSRRLDNDHFRIPALFSGRAVEGMNLNYFEVIGNLYTNPELLTPNN